MDNAYKSIQYKYPLYFSLCYLFFAWICVIIFDFFAWFNNPLPNFMWHHFFKEGSITEMFQWVFIGLSSLYASAQYGKTKNDDPYAKFWLLISLGLMLMLIEDAGNIRHQINGYVQIIIPIYFFSIMTEFLFFATLGILMLLSLIKLINAESSFKNTHLHFIYIGFALYGIAVASSFIGTIKFPTSDGGYFMVYWSIGEFLNTLTEPDIYYRSPFLIPDFLIEESIELLGISFIFSGLIRITNTINN